MTKGLGFADPREGISADLVDQSVDALQDLAIVLLPVHVVLPGLWGENQSHGSRSCSSPPPLFRQAIERSRRWALAGLRRRKVVSSIAL